MDEIIDKRTYLSTLEEANRTICFDGASGKRYLFEKLYHPLALDNGENAFLSHRKRLEISDKGYEPINAVRDERNKLIGELKKHTSEKNPNIETSGNSFAAYNKEIISSIKARVDREERRTVEVKHNAEIIQKEHKVKDSGNEEIVDSSDNINVENKSIGEVSTSNIIDMQGNASDITKDEKDDYGLFAESKYANKQSLFVDTNRVIAIANAGQGKTTLLKRIALFYCYSAFPKLRRIEEDKYTDKIKEHDDVKKAYGLDDTKDYIPCFITLRKFSEKNVDLQECIIDSISDLYQEKEIVVPEESIKSFIQIERNNLLLLIDGLDEVSSNKGLNFLSLLNLYLSKYPQTQVIMTSRVAGIMDEEIMASLKKLKFIGRSIVPLKIEEAKTYSLKWIEETQEGEITKNNLKKRLQQILSLRKYDFLKEFMRTPLELLVILKQLADATLSLDRYQLFHDMLFALLTSHERVDKKGILFEDTMSVLGCIAYQMQLKGNLFLSRNELESIIVQLNALSYHSGIIKNGDIDDFVHFLDNIAMNVGIVEKEQRDGQTVFTFPIRSYQEYLTAHACCHLVVDVDGIRPEPFRILSDRIYEDEWTRIITFALADLYTNNWSEFEKLLEYIFYNENNNTRLCSYIEADLDITKEQAKIVCERFLKSDVLTEQQKRIIMSWSGTQSVSAYNLALRNLFMKSEDRIFSSACAFAIVIDCFMNSNGSFNLLLDNLRETSRKKCMLGAAIVSECISLFYEEDIEGYKELASYQLDLLDDIVPTLFDNAKKYQDVSSIKAISEICIVRDYKESLYRQYLDEELRSYVIDYLYTKEKEAEFLCLSNYQEKPDGLYELLEGFTILGSFPILKGSKYKNVGFYSEIVLKTLFELSKDRINIDQAAIAVAMWYISCDYEQFIEVWTHDICKEKDLVANYRFVRKDYCSAREQAHFKLLKKNKAVWQTADRYMQMKINMINKSSYLNKQSNAWTIFANNNDVYGYAKKTYINEYNRVADVLRDTAGIEEQSVFSLFRKRDILGAAKFCVKNLDKEPNANLVNLGFLIRYGKIRSASVLPYSYDIIPEILSEAVDAGEKYAIMNLALYYLENGKPDDAYSLLKKLSIDDWRELSYGFWKQELWDATGDPEGALVCVLAHEYGRCDFVGYEKMLEVVEKSYANIYKEINTRLV